MKKANIIIGLCVYLLGFAAHADITSVAPGSTAVRIGAYQSTVNGKLTSGLEQQLIRIHRSLPNGEFEYYSIDMTGKRGSELKTGSVYNLNFYFEQLEVAGFSKNENVSFDSAMKYFAGEGQYVTVRNQGRGRIHGVYINSIYTVGVAVVVAKGVNGQIRPFFVWASPDNLVKLK